MVQSPQNPVIRGDGFDADNTATAKTTEDIALDLGNIQTVGAFEKHLNFLQNTLGVALEISIREDAYALKIPAIDGLQDEQRQQAHKGLESVLRDFKSRKAAKSFDEDFITRSLTKAFESESFTLTFEHASDPQKSPIEMVQGLTPSANIIEYIEKQTNTNIDHDTKDGIFTIRLNPDLWNLSEQDGQPSMPTTAQNKIMGEALKALTTAIEATDPSNATVSRSIDRKMHSIKKQHHAQKSSKPQLGEATASDKKAAKVQETPQERTLVYLDGQSAPVFKHDRQITIKRGAFAPLAQKTGVSIKVSNGSEDNPVTAIHIEPEKKSGRSTAKAEQAQRMDHALNWVKRIVRSTHEVTKAHVEEEIDPTTPLRREFPKHNRFVATPFYHDIPKRIAQKAKTDMAFEMMRVDGGYHVFALNDEALTRAEKFIAHATPEMLRAENEAQKSGYSKFLDHIEEFGHNSATIAKAEHARVESRIDQLNNQLETAQREHDRKTGELENKRGIVANGQTKEASRRTAKTAIQKLTPKIEELDQKIGNLDSERSKAERALITPSDRRAAAINIENKYERLNTIYSGIFEYEAETGAPLTPATKAQIETLESLKTNGEIIDYHQTLLSKKDEAEQSLEQCKEDDRQLGAQLAEHKKQFKKEYQGQEEDLEAAFASDEKTILLSESKNKQEASVAAAQQTVYTIRAQEQRFIEMVAERARAQIAEISPFLLMHQRFLKVKRSLNKELLDAKDSETETKRLLKEAQTQYENQVKNVEAAKKKGKTHQEPDPVIVERKKGELADITAEIERLEQETAFLEEQEDAYSKAHTDYVDSILKALSPLGLITAKHKHLRTKTQRRETESQRTAAQNTDLKKENQARALGTLSVKKAQLDKVQETQESQIEALEKTTKALEKDTWHAKISPATIQAQCDGITDEIDLIELATTTPREIGAAKIKINTYKLFDAEAQEAILAAIPLNTDEKTRWGHIQAKTAKKVDEQTQKQNKEQLQREERQHTERRFEQNKSGKKLEIIQLHHDVTLANLARFLGEQEDAMPLIEFFNAQYAKIGFVMEPIEVNSGGQKNWALAFYKNEKASDKWQQHLPVIKDTLTKAARRFNTDTVSEEYHVTSLLDDLRNAIEASLKLKGFKQDPTQSFDHPTAHSFFTSQNREQQLAQIESAFNVKLIPGANKEKGRFDVYVNGTDSGLYLHERIAQISAVFDEVTRLERKNAKTLSDNKNKTKSERKPVQKINRAAIRRIIERAQNGELQSQGSNQSGIVYDPEDEKALAKIKAQIEKDVRKEILLKEEAQAEAKRSTIKAAEKRRVSSQIQGVCEKLRAHFDENPVEFKSHRQKLQYDAASLKQISIADGPAGTGKTHIAVRVAVEKFINGEVDKIIIARPAVEAGISIGFLPGNIDRKFDPYMRPIYDILDSMVGKDHRELLQRQGHLEVCSIGHLRGRTLNDCYLVVDEPQNMTKEQTMMVHTRLGENCLASFCGDTAQCDIMPDMSGFKPFLEDLEKQREKDGDFLAQTAVVKYEAKDAKARSHYTQQVLKLFNESASFSDQEMTIGSMPISEYIKLAEAVNENPDNIALRKAYEGVYDNAPTQEKIVAEIAITQHFTSKVKKRLCAIFGEKAREEEAKGSADIIIYSEERFKRLARDMESDQPALRQSAETVFNRLSENASDEDVHEIYEQMMSLDAA